MNPKWRQFVNAYLGEASGNGARAAILAGYSEKGARQTASRLLTYADVKAAIEKRLAKREITSERVLQRLADILESHPKKVMASDIVSAGKVILQAKGALRDKHGDSRVTVNIGFLQQTNQPPFVTVNELTPASERQVMTSRPRALNSVDDENGVPQE